MSVAGSVLWGAVDALKQLLGGEKDARLQQEAAQAQSRFSSPESIATVLDHHAAASLFMRITSAAAGLIP
jgi:hypothetical protein